VKSFLREESLKIDSMLRDNFTIRKKSIKEAFIVNNNYYDQPSSMRNRNNNIL
jgi:hypothetical protein